MNIEKLKELSLRELNRRIEEKKKILEGVEKPSIIEKDYSKVIKEFEELKKLEVQYSKRIKELDSKIKAKQKECKELDDGIKSRQKHLDILISKVEILKEDESKTINPVSFEDTIQFDRWDDGKQLIIKKGEMYR